MDDYQKSLGVNNCETIAEVSEKLRRIVMGNINSYEIIESYRRHLYESAHQNKTGIELTLKQHKRAANNALSDFGL